MSHSSLESPFQNELGQYSLVIEMQGEIIIGHLNGDSHLILFEQTLKQHGTVPDHPQQPLKLTDHMKIFIRYLRVFLTSYMVQMLSEVSVEVSDVIFGKCGWHVSPMFLMTFTSPTSGSNAITFSMSCER